jgi:hypothetical protein
MAAFTLRDVVRGPGVKRKGSPVSEAAFCEDFEAVMFVIDRSLWRVAADAPHRPGSGF